MSELIDFEYVNSFSLTTLPEHRLISKLASYFNIKQASLRSSLNKTNLDDNGLVTFDGLDIKLPPFYVVSCSVNTMQFMSEANFRKSKVAEAYTMMEAGSGGVLVVYDDTLFVVCDFDKLDLGEGGFGGIFFNYPPQFKNKIMFPLTTWLNLVYPHPPSQI